jgi:hypothetical protein
MLAMTTLRQIYHTVAGLAEHGRRLPTAEQLAWQTLVGQFQGLAEDEQGYRHAEDASAHYGDQVWALHDQLVGTDTPPASLVDRGRRPRDRRQGARGTTGGCYRTSAPGQPPGPGTRRCATLKPAAGPSQPPTCQGRMGGSSHRRRGAGDRGRPRVPRGDQQRGRVDVPRRWPALEVAAGRRHVPGAYRPAASPGGPRCRPACRGPGAPRPRAEPWPVADHHHSQSEQPTPAVNRPAGSHERAVGGSRARAERQAAGAHGAPRPACSAADGQPHRRTNEWMPPAPAFRSRVATVASVHPDPRTSSTQHRAAGRRPSDRERVLNVAVPAEAVGRLSLGLGGQADPLEDRAAPAEGVEATHHDGH